MPIKDICNNPSDSGNLKKGLVQVYTGEGKGKTTAAIGSIIRALGNGLRIHVTVFLKGNHPRGEWAFLSKLPGVTVEQFGTKGFCNPSQPRIAYKKQALLALQAASRAMRSGNYAVIVLDEVNIAVAWQLIDASDVIKLVDEKPVNVELILTGRYADPRIIEKADLVTEMLKIKHPFDVGLKARKGIEF